MVTLSTWFWSDSGEYNCFNFPKTYVLLCLLSWISLFLYSQLVNMFRIISLYWCRQSVLLALFEHKYTLGLYFLTFFYFQYNKIWWTLWTQTQIEVLRNSNATISLLRYKNRARGRGKIAFQEIKEKPLTLSLSLFESPPKLKRALLSSDSFDGRIETAGEMSELEIITRFH